MTRTSHLCVMLPHYQGEGPRSVLSPVRAKPEALMSTPSWTILNFFAEIPWIQRREQMEETNRASELIGVRRE